MNRIRLFLMASCLTILLTGCGVPTLSTAMDQNIPIVATARPESNAAYSLCFPEHATYSYTHDIRAEETLYVREIIKTSTTNIRITNLGEQSLTGCLYDPDDISAAIQTIAIEPGKAASFTGLTGDKTYCIGFQAKQDGNVSVSIEG